VEEMAAHYISEIQSFQPHGPYYVGGSSFGGLVAFEMAKQWRAKHEEVALLAFFDTHAPGYPKSFPVTSVWQAKWNRWKFRLSLHSGNLRVAEGAEKMTYIRKKIIKWTRGQIIMMKRRKKERRERFEQISLPKNIVQTQKAGLLANESYASQKYSGSATLFRATVQPDGIENHRALGWSEYIEGDIEIYDTPGHHGSIVRDPRAKVLAAQLKDSLKKAQSAVREMPSIRSTDFNATSLPRSSKPQVALT
jgi:thioesterase domain-containing protein